MGAPSGIVWGDIADSSTGGKTLQGKIGIYTNITGQSDTEITVNVQVWVATRYACTETANNPFYYDIGPSVTAATTNLGSRSIYHTANSGTGWSSNNHTKVHDVTYTYSKGTSAATYNIYAKMTDLDFGGGTLSVNTTVAIPKRTSYAVTYNANGGTGAPASQSKFHDISLTLSSTVPSRTAIDKIFHFMGWNTSISSGLVEYKPGAAYVNNAPITLYAVWNYYSYSIFFNANGGVNAPKTITKNEGFSTTVPSTIPTREGYDFLGWSRDKNAITADANYDPGDAITEDESFTLCAVWQPSYTPPKVTNFTASRCDSSGSTDDTGTSGIISFSWSTHHNVTSIAIECKNAAGESVECPAVTASGKSGTIADVLITGPLNTDYEYEITVTVSDSGGAYATTKRIPGAVFAIDVLPGNLGVAFGKPASMYKTAEFEYSAKFNKSVYGQVLGLGRLPLITSGDLNDVKYTVPGCYGIRKGAVTNMPIEQDGKLTIYDSTGEYGHLTGVNKYIKQVYEPYNYAYPTFMRVIYTGPSPDYKDTYYQSAWYAVSRPTQRILMNDFKLMDASDVITLSESVQAQPNGIELVFQLDNDSGYWYSFFVSKYLVDDLRTWGNCMVFTMFHPLFTEACSKRLYITNNTITGHANNVDGETDYSDERPVNVFDNSQVYLRYVIGV